MHRIGLKGAETISIFSSLRNRQLHNFISYFFLTAELIFESIVTRKRASSEKHKKTHPHEVCSLWFNLIINEENCYFAVYKSCAKATAEREEKKACLMLLFFRLLLSFHFRGLICRFAIMSIKLLWSHSAGYVVVRQWTLARWLLNRVTNWVSLNVTWRKTTPSH